MTTLYDKVYPLHKKAYDVRNMNENSWPKEVEDALDKMVQYCASCPTELYKGTNAQRLYLQLLIVHCNQLNNLFLKFGIRLSKDGRIVFKP